MRPRSFLFAAILLTILPLLAFSQMRYISHSYGDGPVSRGSIAVIHGVNLAGNVAVAQDPFNVPTELAGVSASIDGILCKLLYVSPDLIRFVVPDEVPPSTYRLTRFGWWISPQVLRVTGFMTHEYRFHLTDTAPWWMTINGNVVGIIMSYTGPVDVVQNGVIPILPNTSVQLRASGCRSFRAPELVFYRVWFYVDEQFFEVEASVTKDVLLPGVDLVKFAPMPEWAGRRGLLFLQTPSNFSHPVEVEFR